MDFSLDSLDGFPGPLSFPEPSVSHFTTSTSDVAPSVNDCNMTDRVHVSSPSDVELQKTVNTSERQSSSIDEPEITHSHSIGSSGRRSEIETLPRTVARDHDNSTSIKPEFPLYSQPHIIKPTHSQLYHKSMKSSHLSLIHI